MIRVNVKEKDGEVIGFHVEGHANYAEYGSDIVCASVSILVINCINSIDMLTGNEVQVSQDEEKGIIDFTVSSYQDEKVKLLLQSLELGLRGIEEAYDGDYITFI